MFSALGNSRRVCPKLIFFGSYLISPDSAWQVEPVETMVWSPVALQRPALPATALTTPEVCWNTPCTPQKQPPAMTAVWMPSDAWVSVAGAGIITASSAACEGATANAATASAPMAAAQNEKRLNGLRDMRFPLGMTSAV